MNYTKYFFLVIIIASLNSCYMYDGPVRIIHREAPKPLPQKVIPAPLTKEEYLGQAFNDIKNKLPEAQVTMIEDSIKVLFPENIRYKPKELYPSTEYQEPLKRFTRLLLKYHQTNILITGHSDNRGNEIKNKEISTLRAKNIEDILVLNGINEFRLKSWGLGSAAPVAENSTLEGRDLNRRVEFVVLYDEH